jgi:hypothetical protein
VRVVLVRVSCVRVCVRACVVCIPFLVDGDDGFHFLCDLIDLAHEDDVIALPPLVYLQTDRPRR